MFSFPITVGFPHHCVKIDIIMEGPEVRGERLKTFVLQKKCSHHYSKSTQCMMLKFM